jgi:hypothetical protein
LALAREALFVCVAQVLAESFPHVRREKADVGITDLRWLAAVYGCGSHLVVQLVSPARVRERAPSHLPQHRAPQCDKPGLLALSRVAEDGFQREEQVQKLEQGLGGKHGPLHPARCEVRLPAKLVERNGWQVHDKLRTDAISIPGRNTERNRCSRAPPPPGSLVIKCVRLAEAEPELILMDAAGRPETDAEHPQSVLGDIPSAFRHPLVVSAGDANCHNAPDGRFEDKPASAPRHLIAIGRQQPQSGNVHLGLDL